MFWKIINGIIMTCIILVIVFSEEITRSINGYRDYLNQKELINDGMHLVRLIINKWEGLALACTLCFLFLIRFIFAGISGLFTKLTQK